jgi:hypothetical protein
MLEPLRRRRPLDMDLLKAIRKLHAEVPKVCTMHEVLCSSCQAYFLPAQVRTVQWFVELVGSFIEVLRQAGRKASAGLCCR